MFRTTVARVVSVLAAATLPVLGMTPPDPALATTPVPVAPAPTTSSPATSSPTTSSPTTTSPTTRGQTLRPAAEQDGSWGDNWGFQLSGGAAATFSDDTTTAH